MFASTCCKHLGSPSSKSGNGPLLNLSCDIFSAAYDAIVTDTLVANSVEKMLANSPETGSASDNLIHLLMLIVRVLIVDVCNTTQLIILKDNNGFIRITINVQHWLENTVHWVSRCNCCSRLLQVHTLQLHNDIMGV